MNWFQKTSQNVPMSIQDVLNHLELNGQSGMFKYVRCGGEYRFADATTMYGLGHKQLAGDDIPESAAFITIRPEGFYIHDHSSTLKMSSDSADKGNLSRLLSMPAVEPREWWEAL